MSSPPTYPFPPSPSPSHLPHPRLQPQWQQLTAGIIVGGVALGALGLFYFLQNRGKKDAKWNEQEAAKDKQRQQQRQQKDVDAEHKATKVCPSAPAAELTPSRRALSAWSRRFVRSNEVGSLLTWSSLEGVGRERQSHH